MFEIREGAKTGVKDIRFVGARAFSHGRLKDVIKTTESNWLSFLQSSDIYDPDRVEADRGEVVGEVVPDEEGVDPGQLGVDEGIALRLAEPGEGADRAAPVVGLVPFPVLDEGLHQAAAGVER